MLEKPTSTVERRLIWSNAALTDQHKNMYAAQLQWKGPVPPSNEAGQQRRHGRLMYSDTLIEAPAVPKTALGWTIISISPACTFSSHAATGCRGNYWDPLATKRIVEGLILFGCGSGPLYYRQGQQAGGVMEYFISTTTAGLISACQTNVNY